MAKKIYLVKKETFDTEVNRIDNDIDALDATKADASSVETLSADKQDKLTAGANITITSDNIISATGGGASYTAGNGISINDKNEIAIDETVTGTVAAENVLQENIDKKVDKQSTTTGSIYVYAYNKDGDTNYKLSTGVADNSIAVRGTSGVLTVGTPTADSHAVNLKYFNEHSGSAAPIVTVSAEGVTGGTIVTGTLSAEDLTKIKNNKNCIVEITDTKEGATFYSDIRDYIEQGGEEGNVYVYTALIGTGSGTDWRYIQLVVMENDGSFQCGLQKIEGATPVELEVTMTSSTEAEGTLTDEQFTLLTECKSPIFLSVLNNGTQVFGVSIRNYWYNGERNEIGSNIILNVGFADDSTQLASLQVNYSEEEGYTSRLTLENFIYKKWITSSEIDNKTIVKGSDGLYKTQVGGYVSSEEVETSIADSGITWDEANDFYTLTTDATEFAVGNTIKVSFINDSTKTPIEFTATAELKTITTAAKTWDNCLCVTDGKGLYFAWMDVGFGNKLRVINQEGITIETSYAYVNAWKVETRSVIHKIDSQFLDTMTKTDIVAALADKQDTLTAGTGITITDNVIAANLPQPLVFKGRVDTVSDLPTSGNTDGDVYFVGLETATNSDMYCWISTAWHKIGTTSIDTSKFLTTDTDQTISGKKTFTNNTYASYIYNNNKQDSLMLCGGLASAQGCRLILYRYNGSDNQGGFKFICDNVSKNSILEGKADGTLTWCGKDISSGGSGPSQYIKAIYDNGDGSYSAIDQDGSTTTTWTIPEIPWEPIQTRREITYEDSQDNHTMAKHLNQCLYDTSTSEVWVQTASESNKWKIYQRCNTIESDTKLNLYRPYVDGTSYKIEFINWYTTDDFESCVWTSTVKTLS